MTKQKQIRERDICLDVLMEVTQKQGYLHLLLRDVLDKYAYLDKSQRGFISRVCEGTVEYMLQLDAVINRYARTKTSHMKPLICNLLRMSVYQILYMSGVPDSAACNEAVKLAQRRGFHGLSGFVNGVLRTISREKEGITFHTLSERYSMPQWLVERWTKAYGEVETERMLQAFLEPKKMYIRCNYTNCTLEELESSLHQDGVKLQQTAYLKEAFRISGYDQLQDLQAFEKGYFQVQDLSSMLSVRAANPKPGDTVLDVCAAPGGKALYAADLLRGSGLVEARDLTEYKVGLIEENKERCGMENLRTSVWDAREYDESWEKKADVVLADLPCSGLGVIGRKMDIKYRITQEQILDLQKLQRDILYTVYNYVKPGGTLVYSTCTITPEENEENVAWIQEHCPLELVSLTEETEMKQIFSMESDTKERGYLQLLPGMYGTDGFFIARFRRKE